MITNNETQVIELIKNADNKAAIGETSVLAKRAILVYPNLSAWGGQKIDRKHTEELLAHHGADNDNTTKVVQQLFKPMVKACRKEIAAMRTRSDELTLPYNVRGWKILPSAMYFDYMREMKERTQKIWRKIEEELSKYEQYLYEERVKKNGLFVLEMYPTKEEIRACYDINFFFRPVPDAGNWIVDVEREEMDKLRASVASEEMENLHNAVRTQWTRLHAVVFKMINSLTVFGEVSEGGKKTRTFRDSLVGNIEDICEILPKLNLTGDAQLSHMIEEVRKQLTDTDPATLRKDPVARKDTLKEAQSILSAMESFMGFVPVHEEEEEEAEEVDA